MGRVCKTLYIVRMSRGSARSVFHNLFTPISEIKIPVDGCPADRYGVDYEQPTLLPIQPGMVSSGAGGCTPTLLRYTLLNAPVIHWAMLDGVVNVDLGDLSVMAYHRQARMA